MIEAKYIPGTDYLVYSDGRIWSNKTHRFMKQCSNGRYMKVALCIKGKLKQFLVHRLVAKSFVPNPENKREVNHIDGNKTNNKVSNLEWVTARENQIHAVKTGLKKHGTDLWNGKFNKEQVVDIIKQHQNGASCYALGRKYGCGATTISAICRGLRYKQYFQKKELQHILWTLGLNANLKI